MTGVRWTHCGGRGCSRLGRWRRRRAILGRILSNGEPAKAAREVRVGDMLRVTNAGGDFEIEVLGLSEIRGPASEAAETVSRDGAEQGNAAESGGRAQGGAGMGGLSRGPAVEARPAQNHSVSRVRMT